jgi:hypothetical protein
MSPPFNCRCLSGRCSRERHCDRFIVTWVISCSAFGHHRIYFPTTLGSTKLCCLGFSATMVALTAVVVFIILLPEISGFAPPDLISRLVAWSLLNPVLRLVSGTQDSTLATISSPFLSRLTFLPFRLQPPHSHFPTSASARYCTQSWLLMSSPRADPHKGS